MSDGNSMSQRFPTVNNTTADKWKKGRSLWDLKPLSLLFSPPRVDGHASERSCDCMLPTSSVNAKHQLSTNVLDAVLDGIEMEYWTANDINEALAVPDDPHEAFIDMWGESWNIVGKAISCSMQRQFDAIAESDKKRLLEVWGVDRAET